MFNVRVYVLDRFLLIWMIDFVLGYSGQVDLGDYRVLKLLWQERICTLDSLVQPVMQWG
jgi:hypothetical protein